jgi:hypothetical protein
MKQLKMISLLIVAGILLCACPDDNGGHRHITFVNKSDKTIVWQPQMHRINEIDTLYDCLKTSLILPSDSIYKFNYDTRESWETGLGTHYYLQFLLMEEKVYSQYYLEPCDTIHKYVPILHRYQLTLEDLERMNWVVVYPPEK